MKIIGIFILIAYFIGGGTITFKSAANGPIGIMIDMFGCFPKDTPITLLNGQTKLISELKLGDVLENKAKIHALLKVKGSKENPYYKIFSVKLNKFIYVTGDHLIKDDKTNKFIPVKDFKYAQKTDMWDEEMYNLVTTNNNIPIGEFTFWDWED